MGRIRDRSKAPAIFAKTRSFPFIQAGPGAGCRGKWVLIWPVLGAILMILAGCSFTEMTGKVNTAWLVWYWRVARRGNG